MTPRVEEALRASHSVPDIGPDTKLSAIKMRNSSTQGGSLVSLLFVDEAPSPRYVLRVPRDPAHPERLAANYAALHRLTGIEAVSGSVPAPTFSDEIDGALVTLESYLDGSSVAMEMAVAERRGEVGRVAETFARAAEWLWRLHEATWDTGYSGFVVECQADIDVLADSGFLSHALEMRLRALASVLGGEPLPYAWCHGDFNPNNLLQTRDAGMAVVDWEYAGPDCALFDLFQLATIGWVFPAWPGEVAGRYRLLWAADTALGRAFTAAVGRYAERADLSVERLRAAFPLYVCRMAADLTRLIGARPEKMVEFWRELLGVGLEG